jgi:hypothetical protein
LAGIGYAAIIANNERRCMQGEGLAGLIEEMIDLKIRQHAGTGASTVKLSREVAMVLAATKFEDQKRLQQIRTELARLTEAKEV